MTDKEMLEELERNSRCRGNFALVYDDLLLLKALRMTDVKECPVCHSSVEHSISSECAGHGDFPRFLNIECQGCGISTKECISYGGSISEAIEAFKRKAEHIIKAVKDHA